MSRAQNGRISWSNISSLTNVMTSPVIITGRLKPEYYIRKRILIFLYFWSSSKWLTNDPYIVLTFLVTSTEEYKLKMVVRAIKNLYDKYGRYKPIRDIFTDVVWRYTYTTTLKCYDYFEPLSTTVPIPTWGSLVSTYFIADRDRFKISGIRGCMALKSAKIYMKFRYAYVFYIIAPKNLWAWFILK